MFKLVCNQRNTNENGATIPYLIHQFGRKPKILQCTLLARLWENRPFCALFDGNTTLWRGIW